MQPSQRRARLDAKLVAQHLVAPPVLRQGVGLPASPRQRHHQLPTQPFPERVPRDQRLQLPDQLLGATQRELGVETPRQHLQPQLLELVRRRAQQRRRPQSFQRRPPPQIERVPE